ncbi:MAG: CrcB family protein [Actinobacteria bacterium]|nr:CrcB family protein [Actinomycetota bacterium]
MTAVVVIAGAVAGAPLRYLTDLLVGSRHGSVFPWGTLIVNAAGSLIAGAVAGAVSRGAPGWLLTLAGTGFCGALTTFSTFGLETMRLAEEGSMLEAVLNIGASLLIGLVACAGGWALAAAIA